MSDRIVHSTEPLNVEPSLSRLRAEFITSQEDFYIRSHGDVPHLDAATHRLRVHGRVATPLDLSLDDLRAGFPHRTVAAVMQCAGNRRSELGLVQPVEGDPWAQGAIGHAEWGGVALADVLRVAGVEGGRHVAFEALDECRSAAEPFAISIPLAKALAPEVVLAWAMNGEPLAPEHGYPLRAVVPGFAGIRSAKWLAGIEVRDSPADSKAQREDYKLFPAEVTKQTADPARGITIDAMPLNAAICEPAAGASLRAGLTPVRGYAISSGNAVCRVEISSDSGVTWRQARLQQGASPWSWTFWEASIDLSPGRHELAVRAWDSAGQTQPARPDEIWNYRGYLCNAWHRVEVSVG